MQQSDGTFKMLSEEEADKFLNEGKGGKILRIGQTALILNRNDAHKEFIIESIGARFVRVRAATGKHWGSKIGEEVTIEDCAFVIRRIDKARRIMVLEGVPPSPTESSK